MNRTIPQTKPKIRPAAVAGLFYPAEPRALAAEVDACLRGARVAEGPPPRAVIAPHAGYVYSGPIAGSAFATLSPLRGAIRRVVLIGPSHRLGFRGLAAPTVDAFATPLGVIPLDRVALDGLRDLPQVVVRDDAHAREHSLEVELPFLQRVLGEFALVPLAAGSVTDAEVMEVLARFVDEPATLIVVSSDLSHYLPYDAGRRIDAETSRAIEALEPAALDGERACGYAGVRGLLELAKQRGLRARTLDLRSSGDTAGSRDQVVGYGAYVFEETRNAARSDTDLEALLGVARDSIRAGVETGRALRIEPSAFPPALREHRASFVTLHLDGGLRGCIGGLIATRPLVADVAAHAYAAAYHDPRFAPMTAGEADRLEIHVSVLSPLEPLHVRSELDLLAQLRPGVDGLVLEHGQQRATFLPAVWSELPEPRAFVAALKRKAGLHVGFWSPEMRVQRYAVDQIPRDARAR